MYRAYVESSQQPPDAGWQILWSSVMFHTSLDFFSHFIAVGVLCVYEFLCALWDAQRPKPVSFDIGSLLFLHTQIAHKWVLPVGQQGKHSPPQAGT